MVNSYIQTCVLTYRNHPVSSNGFNDFLRMYYTICKHGSTCFLLSIRVHSFLYLVFSRISSVLWTDNNINISLCLFLILGNIQSFTTKYDANYCCGCVCVCVGVCRGFGCIHVSMYICVHVSMCVCMCIYVYVHAYMCMCVSSRFLKNQLKNIL